MKDHILTDRLVQGYCQWLTQNERSAATVEKYRYYLQMLQKFLKEQKKEAVTKESILLWKEQLRSRMAPSTINGALSAANGLFHYAGWEECTARLIRVKRQTFCRKQQELLRTEYERLIRAARGTGNERMELLIQTVCSTGIRISELAFVTVEALRDRCAEVDCKGRIRRIFLTEELCRRLEAYCRKRGIQTGGIFVTRTGRPMDRSNIWREMKQLAEQAGVDREKVFPHNLRHLFARVYYSREKDLLRLSDILGHSNINTTRIYTMESGEIHRRQLEELGLLIEEEDKMHNRISLLL